MRTISRKLLLISVWLTLVSGPLYAIDGLTKAVFDRLCGNWYIIPKDKIDNASLATTAFGWGAGRYIPNGTMDIDLVSGTIYLPGLFELPIRAVKADGDDQITLEAYFERGDFSVRYVFHYLSREAFWLSYEGQGKLYSWVGKDHVYTRVDGPKEVTEKTGVVTNNSVRIRERPSTDGRILGKLNAGEKVDLLARSVESDRIEGNESRWYFVVTRNGASGWVFGFYLK